MIYFSGPSLLFRHYLLSTSDKAEGKHKETEAEGAEMGEGSPKAPATITTTSQALIPLAYRVAGKVFYNDGVETEVAVLVHHIACKPWRIDKLEILTGPACHK